MPNNISCTNPSKCCYEAQILQLGKKMRQPNKTQIHVVHPTNKTKCEWQRMSESAARMGDVWNHNNRNTNSKAIAVAMVLDNNHDYYIQFDVYISVWNQYTLLRVEFLWRIAAFQYGDMSAEAKLKELRNKSIKCKSWQYGVAQGGKTRERERTCGGNLMKCFIPS